MTALPSDVHDGFYQTRWCPVLFPFSVLFDEQTGLMDIIYLKIGAGKGTI